ncbi:VOC family protein [Lysinibacillus sphaericus]|uniref:VOC family protein n=1 Tax=Lysinibacillus sphaericus TaxID=1421 RepID=UPI0025A1CCB5|nr:VOC family protein [Lysinibacillus sphaericus]MDM5349584.1 VOC family protein [Lysinibacillus sphaericus]
MRSLLNGVEAIFIPIKDPQLSVKWYEEKLGFKLLNIEEDAAVMKIGEQSVTVVCLVKTENHQPLHFPDNHFGVGKYFNFLSSTIEDTYQSLVEQQVKVNPIGGEGQIKFFTFYDLDGNPLGGCQS